ncbi:MAG: exo-alpha-sialidase [Bryobacterales bacterium]|nr:exo-alpha-sialidase [Bryobacterales bacterium]
MRRRTFFGVSSLILGSGAAQAQGTEALWDERVPMPKASELAELRGVRFSVIQAHEPERDGYGFLHGVALGWHKGKLYASWGHNKGRENTAGEQARGRVSADGGRTWGEVFDIDTGDAAAGLAVSHGAFLSHGGRLWAFLGAFYGSRTRVHTRAYVLREETGRWESRGTVVEGGFWPMAEPVRMSDGNWVMAGFVVGEGEPAAVAVSRGDDFTKWERVVIPRAAGLGTMWGESGVWVEGRSVVNVARYGAEARALVARSEDGGRRWSEMRASNLPMVTSKPYVGVLSTGQRYLIGTTAADTGKRRAPLTIAVSRRGGRSLEKVFRIRDAEMAGGAWDSHARANLAYPYAVEREGLLYVGYSNNGGRTGMNINSAEMAVIPVETLAV